jgi:hypothetical protein
MHFLFPPRAGRELSDALDLMTSALAILDALNAPGRIGATLDHAITSLSGLLARSDDPSGGVQSLIEQLERELSQASAPDDSPPSPWEKS